MKILSAILLVIIFIILIPIIIPLFLYDEIWHKRKVRRKAYNNKFSYQNNIALSHKIKPVEPQNNEDFIANLNKFTEITYYSRNYYSGSLYINKLVASEHPELKEKILSFLEQYPIINLLQGNRDCAGCDMNHWEIAFRFEDSSLDKSIFGYGITECTAPYLTKMISFIPPVLSEREQIEMRIKREKLKNILLNIYTETEENNNTTNA